MTGRNHSTPQADEDICIVQQFDSVVSPVAEAEEPRSRLRIAAILLALSVQHKSDPFRETKANLLQSSPFSSQRLT